MVTDDSYGEHMEGGKGDTADDLPHAGEAKGTDKIGLDEAMKDDAKKTSAVYGNTVRSKEGSTSGEEDGSMRISREEREVGSDEAAGGGTQDDAGKSDDEAYAEQERKDEGKSKEAVGEGSDSMDGSGDHAADEGSSKSDSIEDALDRESSKSDSGDEGEEGASEKARLRRR